MIFLTVGTLFPFDRLIKAVDQAYEKGLFEEEIFAQTGNNSYKPRNFECVYSLDKHLFDEKVQKASGIISHGGIGIISTALQYNKPLLVMPRMTQFKEHVNNHQVSTVRRFEQDGYVLAAYDAAELAAKIKKLKSFVPAKRQPQTESVAKRIATFLNEMCESKNISLKKE